MPRAIQGDLTRQYVDVIAPEHGRTSCSDEHPDNGYYKIKEETLRGVVVRREFAVHPRCNRCFLLMILDDLKAGIPTDPALQIETDVRITLKQPEFEITQKG